MNLDLLEKLGDDDLRAIIARAETLLKEHDTQRKDKALSEARALLESVGLNLKDLARVTRKSKVPAHQVGRIYRHPANAELVWRGKGKTPAWLTALEKEGGKALEMERDVVGSKRSGESK